MGRTKTVKPSFSLRARSARFALVAAVLLAVYLLLGALVSSRPPGPLDRWAHALLGQALPLALAAYQTGLFRTYAALVLLAVAFAVIVPSWRGRVAFSVVALLVSWVVSDFFKDFFERPRPVDWVGVHETSYSYSSGHATLTLVVYGLWAYYLWCSPLPARLRAGIAGFLVLWCLIVGWSRLAMGAHYPTDVLGGWILGFGILAALRAVSLAFEGVRLSARPAAEPPT